MPRDSLILVAALLGMLVGVWATAAFFGTERRRRRDVIVPAVSDSTILATSILDALPQDFIILDRFDHVEEASTRAYSYGLVRDGEIAREQISAIVAEVRSDGLKHVDEVRMSRSALEEELESRLIVRSTPMSAGRVLILFEDNTAQLRLEETRRDFTANISHELKTPVGAVSLLAETIETNATDPEAVRHFAKNLAKESRRLATLVQDIIELSRLQAGDALSTSDLVSIDAVVADAVDRMRVEADDRSVILVSGGTRGLKVFGDKKLLTTAVRNLLDNAVRYSRPQSRVSVGISSRDGLVSIAVVDQGEGIAAPERERIFERFYRADKARSRETGGSGLGLSIVKHVVSDHGGRITLWSAPGQGSTFTILLPEARTHADPAGTED